MVLKTIFPGCGVRASLMIFFTNVVACICMLIDSTGIMVHLARIIGPAVVLLDQSAVFDTIDHDTLLDSLSSWFGVSVVVLDWRKSNLSDRVQGIKIGSIISDAKKILYGVPQGSVLGPILF